MTVLAVTAIETPAGWKPASGRARLAVDGRLDDLHRGDAVEVAGRLSVPEGRRTPARWITGRTCSTSGSPRRCAQVHRRRSDPPGGRLAGSLFGWLAVTGLVQADGSIRCRTTSPASPRHCSSATAR